jgi:uncharacterized protein YggU (UPF0235/DUF167 family)
MQAAMGTRLYVRLTPRGNADRLEGWATDPLGRTFLKARVSAPPSEGLANAKLVALIAASLGVSHASVRLAKGGRSRLKMLEIDGLEDEEIHRRLNLRR